MDTRRRTKEAEMASLYLWKGNDAVLCKHHATPSDWDYEPLSPQETAEFVAMIRDEGLNASSPCEGCETGSYGPPRPGGPLTFAEAVLTA